MQYAVLSKKKKLGHRQHGDRGTAMCPWDLLPPPLLARKTIMKVNPAQDMLILIKKKREHAKTELQGLENMSQREPREYALDWILWTLTQGRQKIKLKEGVFREL